MDDGAFKFKTSLNQSNARATYLVQMCEIVSLFAGSMIDSFARAKLWEIGLDYGHGTGHGVGAFLNLHEGQLDTICILMSAVDSSNDFRNLSMYALKGD